MSNLMITAPEIPTSAQQWMPDKADTFAEGLMEILRDAISLLRPDIMEASGACLGIIAAALIVSILQTFSQRSQYSSLSDSITEKICAVSIFPPAFLSSIHLSCSVCK